MGNFLSAVGEIATNESAYRNAMVAAIILLLAALGELVAEKAGTINISLEGMMLAGAFAAAIGQDLTGSVWVGLVFAVVAGVAVAMVQSNMSHRLPADQFVVGLVLNVLVLGVVGFLAGEIDPTTNIVGRTRIPLLADIPLLGPALFDQPWVLYLAFPMVPLFWYLIYRSRWGLEVRAVGEDPNAADVSGLHVNRLRRQTIHLAGVTAGLAGAMLLFAAFGPIRGLARRRSRVHRHRRRDLRWLDLEGHGCRLRRVRHRRFVRAHDPESGIRVDRSVVPGDGAECRDDCGDGSVRQARAAAGGAGEARSYGVCAEADPHQRRHRHDERRPRGARRRSRGVRRGASDRRRFHVGIAGRARRRCGARCRRLRRHSGHGQRPPAPHRRSAGAQLHPRPAVVECGDLRLGGADPQPAFPGRRRVVGHACARSSRCATA